jgi:hypothetical protein
MMRRLPCWFFVYAQHHRYHQSANVWWFAIKIALPSITASAPDTTSLVGLSKRVAAVGQRDERDEGVRSAQRQTDRERGREGDTGYGRRRHTPAP